jgi:hypothetical protein
MDHRTSTTRAADRPRLQAPLFGAALAVTLLLQSSSAAAGKIKQPGDHPDYTLELEPHALVGFDVPKGGSGFGPGVRATIELVDNGFVATINNTVGIGFGADFIVNKHFAVWLPVVMQWNFWVHEDWSVFGEPGGGIWLGNEFKARPAAYGGARWHFAEGAALTLRAGYPAISVGVSLLF